MLKCHTWPRQTNVKSLGHKLWSIKLLRNNDGSKYWKYWKWRNASKQCICTLVCFPQASCWSHEGDSLPLQKNSPNVQGKEVSNGSQAYSDNVSYKTHQNSLDVDQTTWPTRHRICMEHLHPLVHWSINIVTELAIQKVLRDNRNRHCETRKQQLRTTITVDIKYEKSQSLRIICGHIHDACDRNDMTRSPAFAYWPMPWAWLESAGNFTASKREPSKAQPWGRRGHWLD